MTERQLVGMQKSMADEQTGVPVEFHTVTSMSLDYAYKIYSVTIGSWYNKPCFEQGKSAVSSLQLTLSGAPPRGVDFIDWALTSVASLGNANSPYAGAELIESK